MPRAKPNYPMSHIIVDIANTCGIDTAAEPLVEKFN